MAEHRLRGYRGQQAYTISIIYLLFVACFIIWQQKYMAIKPSITYTYLLAVLFWCLCLPGNAQQRTYLFVGTYTNAVPNKGLFVYDFNNQTGELKKLSHVQNITNPSFITIAPNGQYLYACTDTKMPNAGSVSAFKIDSVKGRLTFINKQASGGENPVYVSVHKNNKYVVNANYTEGNVSVFTCNENGSLNPYTQLIQFTDSSINRERQDKAHIHAAVFSPQNDYVFLPDLGADKIRVFKFDTLQKQPLIAMPDYTVQATLGSGPRHFTFHPTKPLAYCIEELGGTVTAYNYQNGKLDTIQRIRSYRKLQTSYGSADIHISPDGLFLYASNRWDDENTIAIFSINQQNGKLTLVGHQKTYGDHPRNFTIDPTGNFLLVANQVTNNIIVFKRNSKTGLLTKTRYSAQVTLPSCLQMRTYNKN
ncbi:MAG: lactonase family protein [Bacteroidota bacterium]